MADVDLDCPDVAARPISAIDLGSVHRICSGQVVLTLATAIKELVENALDAGASNVQVTLEEYGLESIEVADDGHGVAQENFQKMTLKHYTSKIRDFSDLSSVTSFGFRGEALSSLCALGHMSVVTRAESSSVATHLTFDKEGTIVSSQVAARSVGTTVTVNNIFYSMPVRRKEFEKNIKREFGKMLQLLTAYCLSSRNVRISCVNHVQKCRKTILSTSGVNSVKDNIISVFGLKEFQTLIPIKNAKPSSQDLSACGLSSQADDDEVDYVLDGYVSTCSHGKGKSSNDRQFFYINGRPCSLGKVSKMVNEIYHGFNRSQYPFVYLNISLPTEMVDVNLTPDKRKVFLDKEKHLMALIRASFNATFDDIPQVFEYSNEAGTGSSNRTSSNSSFSCLSALKRSFSADSSSTESGEAKQKKLYSYFVKRKSNSAQRETEATSELTLVRSPSTARNSLFSDTPSRPTTTIEEAIPTTSRSADDTLEEEEPPKEVVISQTPPKAQSRRSIRATFDLSRLSTLHKETAAASSDARPAGKAFHAKICPEENESAERELKRCIRKEDFLGMEILGQFNLGFIVTRLGDDLFVVDQHASDEKYNFETLEKSALLQSQNMVVPQPMGLTAADELLLTENLDLFRKYGFDFETGGAEGNRVRLKSVPHYRNWTFGKEDVEELLFLLRESPESPWLLKPSKLRSMLASRACRTSVMIGTALTKSEMTKLVRHLAEIDQPWNCPHGRPTMRHVVNLTRLK